MSTWDMAKQAVQKYKEGDEQGYLDLREDLISCIGEEDTLNLIQEAFQKAN